MNKFTIEFTQDQLQGISAALVEMPFKISAPLINHINAEIQKQFDTFVDKQDIPTGATKPKDMFAGD